MKFIFLICFIISFLYFPLFRLILKNPHNIYFYGFKDIYNYFKFKRWEEYNFFGIDLFIGMFGHGKTLSMSHRAMSIYKRYGDKVRFISNYDLKDIPYIELINFNQLVDLGEETESKYIGTVVLIDEVENLLSHRNFSSFPLELLHMLTQQRKKKVYILASCQRYFQCDKLFRTLATNVYDCKKIWRFQNMKVYDAWDYEQAMNSQLLQPKQNIWWFVKNKDFECYDTSQMIMKASAENFISNEESIVRKGLDSMTNEQAIKRPNRKRMKQSKR